MTEKFGIRPNLMPQASKQKYSYRPSKKITFYNVLISQKEINFSVNHGPTVTADRTWVRLCLCFYTNVKSLLIRKLDKMCEKGVKKHEKYTLKDRYHCISIYIYTRVCIYAVNPC